MNVKETVFKYIYVDEGDKRLARLLAVVSLVLIAKIALFSVQNIGVDF